MVDEVEERDGIRKRQKKTEQGPANSYSCDPNIWGWRREVDVARVDDPQYTT